MSTIMSEKMFYIMDYSSHYYKVNSKDQLVAAGCENEATIFSFADANRRIGAGPKSRFYYMTPVDTVDEEPEDVEEERSTQTEMSQTVPGSSDKFDFSAIDWGNYITQFLYIASNIDSYKEELAQKLGETDKKICDILHYIELCDTDEAEAQGIVELLRICREKRREYKDEIFKAEMFRKNIGTNNNISKAGDAIKSINGLANRKYKPRELPELFDNEAISIKLQEKKHPAEITEQIDAAEYREEVRQMDYVKRETPFDGKENDWLEFARKQAEFYENASQYIINLELELDEIDNATADLMDEIEVANCNVTQGYKMFKQLKDLRQARARKESEIKILYNLTGNFDMAAMAAECRRSAEEIDISVRNDDRAHENE